MPTATTKQTVSGLYAAFFNRAPDNAGLESWADKLDNQGQTVLDIAAQFAAHPVFESTYGEMDNRAFVEEIYVNMLGSAGDEDGIQYWVDLLSGENAQSRSWVVAEFVKGALTIDLDAQLEAGNLTQEEYDAAVIRQDSVTNKANVGVMFAEKLGADSNIGGSEVVEEDPAYKASVEALKGVDNTEQSVTDAEQKLDDAVASGNPVYDLTGEQPVPEAEEGEEGEEGTTFTLTTSNEEEVNGTSNNDTFVATSATLNADDEVDGGDGTDIMNLKLTADTAATDVANVEVVNVSIATFADATVDFTNFDDVTNVNVTMATAGYSDAVTFTEGGSFEYDFGADVDSATFTEYDDGLIHSGDLTTLDLTGGRTLNLNAEGNITSLTTDDVDYVIDFVNEDASVTLAAGSTALTGDVSITGTGTLGGNVAQLSGATYAASGMTLKLTTAGNIDLEEQDIAALQIDDATTASVTNAEDQVINITGASADVAIDTSDEGGSFEVNVTADNVTLDVGAAGTDELDSADVNVTASATVDSMLSFEISSTTNVNVTGGDFEFEAVTEAADSNILNLTGDADVTFTDIAVTSLEAADYTGDITITDSTLATATSLTTGSGGDTVTIDTGTDTSYTINTNAGADRINFTAYVGDADEGLYANAGADDDTFIATTSLTAATDSSYIFVGGAGTDTVDLDAAGQTFDLSAGTVAFESIEALKVAGDDEAFGSEAFDGVTGMTVYGTSAADETITVDTAATAKGLDMSGVALDSTFEGFTVDLSATSQTTTAFSATLTEGADDVTGLNTAGMKAFEIDLGAGNDTYTMGEADGVLTLGAGDDTVVFATGASTVGVNTLVSITDFKIADDVLETTAGDVGGDEIAVDVHAADELGLASDITASAEDGIVSLGGVDAAAIDTLAEWISVVEAVHTAENTASESAWAFEFDGNTYVVNTNASFQEDCTVELTGVTNITALGAAVAENTIVIA